MSNTSLYYKRNTLFINRVVDNKIYLMNTEEGDIHILNNTATVIWKFLNKPRTVDEISHRLEEEYNVNSEIAKNDVKKFIKKALKQKLVKQK